MIPPGSLKDGGGGLESVLLNPTLAALGLTLAKVLVLIHSLLIETKFENLVTVYRWTALHS